MIMFPTHLSSSKYVHHGGFSEGGFDCFISLGRGFSDLMAEDESRTETSTNNDQEEAGSSSKDINMNTDEDDDQGRNWLQLSLGTGGGHTTTTDATTSLTGEIEISLSPPSVTLDLLRGGASSSNQTQQFLSPPQLIFQLPEFPGPHTMSSTLFLQSHQTAAAMNSVPFVPFVTSQHHQQQQQEEQQETNNNYLHLIRPFPGNMMTSPLNHPPVSSSSSFSGSSEQHGRPINVDRRLSVARVINPPRRPHSGVWFVLQASQNQAKEPFLPQIPKSYMRIKDGRMTVGLLIKYLVNKLELGSESEVEITCKGHQLLSILTIQHVRDTIWNSPRNDVGFTVVPRSSATINHLMVLNYGRIA